MQCFLSDRHSEYLLHQHATSQDSFRKDEIQTVMDKIDELGLSGKNSGN
jgi:hypothetical protein